MNASDNLAGSSASAPPPSTLAAPAVSSLLARLHAESDASDARAGQLFAGIPREEVRRRMSEPTGYQDFYRRAKDLYLSVSPETARLLYLLARASSARAIVEFGTSFGLSTIYLAAALRDNGGGVVIGSELEPDKAAAARRNLAAAGLADLADIREGEALETLARDLPAQIDLVLLDGHKGLYPAILALVLPHLRRGAALVADNIEASPDYVAQVRAPGGRFLSVPFAEGVELSILL